jgi:transglutaminase-like putative cysteine protease
MLIRLGYDISFDLPYPTSIVAMLHVHPSRVPFLQTPDTLRVEPELPIHEYTDSFGNICTRVAAPAGNIRFLGEATISDSGEPDHQELSAREHPIEDLPDEVLQFLLSSRYCEVDLLSVVAYELFGHIDPGWGRVRAVCDWVWSRVRFGYAYARSTRTALDVYTERVGVCRDFQHLAITFCRALKIPARYATGYLGDIQWPVSGPMDFSAWFEVYLENKWWTFDGRHKQPRIGRVLMATGRDAADVALTTSFGTANLRNFFVISDEVTTEQSNGGTD